MVAMHSSGDYKTKWITSKPYYMYTLIWASLLCGKYDIVVVLKASTSCFCGVTGIFGYDNKTKCCHLCVIIFGFFFQCGAQNQCADFPKTAKKPKGRLTVVDIIYDQCQMVK